MHNIARDYLTSLDNRLLSKNLKPVSVLTIFLFTASRWFSRRNAPPNDVNLSGTQFGEIGDHVTDLNQ